MKKQLAMVTLLLTAAFILRTNPCFSFDDPDNFRGIKWGSSPADATKIITEQLKQNGNEWSKITDLGNGTLVFDDTFGSTYSSDYIPVTFILNFLDNKFVSAQLSFKPEEFSKIEEIFVKRYGRATSAKNNEVHNPMGARFTNRQLDWIGKSTVVQLMKYAGTVTSGAGFIGQKTWLQHRAQESKKRTTDAARGL